MQEAPYSGVEWIPEAIAKACGTQGVPDPAEQHGEAPATHPQPSIQPSKAAVSRSNAGLWLEQWELLLRKEGLAAADLASAVSATGLTPKELQADVQCTTAAPARRLSHGGSSRPAAKPASLLQGHIGNSSPLAGTATAPPDTASDVRPRHSHRDQSHAAAGHGAEQGEGGIPAHKARGNMAAGELSLPQLRQRLWQQVNAVRDAVGCVQQQLATPQPGPSYVAHLTAAIQQVDQLLGSFHTHNTPAVDQLDLQATQLEGEVEAAALRIEEELAAEAAGQLLPAPALAPHPQQRSGSVGRQPSAAPSARRHTADGNGCSVAGPVPGACPAAPRRSLPGGRPASSILTSHPRPAVTRKPPPEPAFLRVPTASAPGSAGPSGAHGAAGTHARPGSERSGQRPTQQQPQGRLAPEVVAFEEFVAETGEWGGWAREDHEEFEKILKACAGDYTHAVRVAEERCVGFTQSELMAHARWHMDYMDLLVRKRMAVAAWRVRRDTARVTAQAQAALLVPEPSMAPAVQAASEQAAAEAAAAAAARDAAATKQLVVAWKQRKADAERDAAARAAAAAQQAAARRGVEVSERQHMNKLKLEVYNDIKRQQAQEAARRAAEAAERERALRAVDTNQAAAAVAARSAALTARKQQLAAQKHARAMQRAEAQQLLLEQVSVNVPDDPNRVLKGTTAHMSRVQQRRASDPMRRDSGFILTLPQRLAQPSWRAGMAGDR